MSGPRISVVLPTRNGGALLEGCLRSVLANPESDLEIVVSDNASEDETPNILARVGNDDSRLRRVRQAAPLSVTDNWTAALREATGTYVLLIGDDDLLLPGTIARLKALLARHGDPDCLSFNGVLYAYPGATAPGAPAQIADPFVNWGDDLPAEGELGGPHRRRIVEALSRFEVGFCLNLQTTLVARQALERLPHGPFRNPYPDFYAVIALLLRARRWAHVDERLVVVGISPKSFGPSLQREDTGRMASYLGVATRFPGALPGSELINGLHATLDVLRDDLPEDQWALSPDRDAYAAAQVVTMVQQARAGTRDRQSLFAGLRELDRADWAGVGRRAVRRLSPAHIGGLAGLARPEQGAAVWTGLEPCPEATDAAALLGLLARRSGA